MDEAKSFNNWLLANGFEKESKERYTISRVYLYELYLRENGKTD